MDARNVIAARRARRAAERLALPLQASHAPSLGDVFRQGFMNGSLLQLAVCTPSRRAQTSNYAALYITRLGEKAQRREGETVATEIDAVGR